MARGEWAEAMQEADRVVEHSRARTRVKYEALGVALRAAAKHHLRWKGAAAAPMPRSMSLGDSTTRPFSSIV
ncbi:MAG TPA: hypothetical protein VH138_05115 [Vicinamibacterales bacterium]|jgi:hypothetical protein|nr:hypothetical protein [Vicinamibacterales bacterium]